MFADSLFQAHFPITRIRSLKNHRIFRDFAWPDDLEDFAKFNLVYGWNGSGKTTLANLFASIERRVNITEGVTEFIINGTRVAGSALDTAVGLPAIRVFTRDVVSSSIFTGGTDLAPIYYFGKENVEAQRQLEELRKERTSVEGQLSAAQTVKSNNERDLDRFCIEQAKLIKELLTAPGSQYNNYDKAGFRRSCESLAEGDWAPRLLSDDEKNGFKQEKDAQVKPAVHAVQVLFPQLPSLTAAAMNILQKTVVSQVIASLAANPEEAAWVKQGLALHTDGVGPRTCKFCGNTLPQGRVQSLEGHFNDQYNLFLQEIDAATADVEGALHALEGFSTPDQAALYDHLAATYLTARESLAAALTDIRDYLSSLLCALSAKRDKPFEPLSLGNFVSDKNAGADTAAAEQLAVLNSIIEAHNQHNRNFDQKKANARRKLEECLVAEAHPRYEELLNASATAGTEVSVAAESIQQLGIRIMALERSLIEHQTPAEELTAELHSFLGRDDLVLSVQSTGYTITRQGRPATNLSEGEKSAIAFLYFLKSLRDRSFDLKKSVVVVDDPICSLDSNTLFSAFGYMKGRTKDAAQLFILTHNFSFYRQVKNWFHHLKGQRKKDVTKRPARFFMLTRGSSPAGDVAAITRLPNLLEEHESEYHYLFKRVYTASQLQVNPDSLAELYPLPNLARRLLETFMAFRYPGYPGELFDKMEGLAFDEGKKVAILRFLNTFSHDSEISGEEHDVTVLMETPQILASVMELIKSEDPGHYEQMIACVSEEGMESEDLAQPEAADQRPLLTDLT